MNLRMEDVREEWCDHRWSPYRENDKIAGHICELCQLSKPLHVDCKHSYVKMYPLGDTESYGVCAKCGGIDHGC